MVGTADAFTTPYSGNTWLDSITWGTQWFSGSVESTVVSVYIAGQSGDEWVNDGLGGLVQAYDLYAEEMTAMNRAMSLFEVVCNIDFQLVGSAANADVVWASVDDIDGNEFQGWAKAPAEGYVWGEAQSLIAINWERYDYLASDPSFLVQGSYDFTTFIHELGHAIGLAHPHDDGGHSTFFPGVTSAFYDYGDFAMNQGVFTMMSYNSGWQTGPLGSTPSDAWGNQAGPMALDIAALQFLYGQNMSYRTGDDTYRLPSANQVGTYYSCIWDAGGTDMLVGVSDRANTIDLRAATLAIGSGGGGYVSFASGIHGGFTVANGVVIEKATGGAMADAIRGNNDANVLTALGGNDTLWGGGGADILDGGTATDRLEGGLGNDTYVVDVASDVVVEAAAGGTDQVKAAVSWTLGTELENLVLTGTGAINGTGNALANRLTGNGANNVLSGAAGLDTLLGGAGADTLNGGAAKDALTGGLGNDAFVFASLAEAGDTVSDFRNASGDNDVFRISAAGFGGGLVAGRTLASSQFRARADNLAQDADDRFIFRSTDKTLWFDSNGKTTGGLTLVADLQADATVSYTDILLV